MMNLPTFKKVFYRQRYEEVLPTKLLDVEVRWQQTTKSQCLWILIIDKEVNLARKNISIQTPQRQEQWGSARGNTRHGSMTTSTSTPKALQAPMNNAVSDAVCTMKEFGF
jgi:hypothetical protein